MSSIEDEPADEDFGAFGVAEIRQVVALGRAELDRPHSPHGDPDAQRALCRGMEPFGKPLSRSMLAMLEPLMSFRSEFFDQHVVDAIAAGVRQVVICGAGYDDRALRFRHPDVRFFELDLPETILDKSRRLRTMGIDGGEPTLLATNLQTDDAAAVLAFADHDEGAPTLFLCEHLLVFLDVGAVERLLEGLARRAAPGSRLAATIEASGEGLDPVEALASTNALFKGTAPLKSILPRGAWLDIFGAAGWEAQDPERITGIDHTDSIQTQLVAASPAARPLAQWQSSWGQAMTDVRGFGVTFTNVTLCLHVVANLGGDHVRVELSNRFGEAPLVVGRTGIALSDRVEAAMFDGQSTVVIPAGQSRWTDPVALTVELGDEIRVDVYLPETTLVSTANFARTRLQVSTPGDHVGSHEIPVVTTPTVPAPDGSFMPLPLPLLRGIEVSGRSASALVVCLGDSITAGGWPLRVAALLPPEARIAMLDRGIAGNRLCAEPDALIASFGRSGVSRFDEDVVATAKATDVVIALGTNDLGLPGTVAPLTDLPTAAEMIDAYRQLIARAAAAGLHAIVATITPFLGADGYDREREQIRKEVNEWIRIHAPSVVDFDAAVRSESSPSELDEKYDSGDHLHPNELGETRLAEVMAELFRRLELQ